MANDISGRPWVLDTPGATVLWKGWIKSAQIELANYTAQGNKVIIKDQNGRVVCRLTGAADLSTQRSGNLSWFQGLILDTLDSGVALIFIQ